MNTADYNRLIAKISWRYIPAVVHAKDGHVVSLLLRQPTVQERARAAVIYSNEYQHAITIGLSSEEDVIKDMVAIGMWSDQKDIEIKGVEQDIYKIRRGLLDLLFKTTQLEKARSLLRRAESVLIDRLSQRHNLTQNSAESYASTCQQRYIISCITETEDYCRFWSTDDDFNQFDDIGLIIQLCDIFFHKSHIPVTVIRELARSQRWRSYWEIAKYTNSLFDGPVMSWSVNQQELAYWSTIYDSVYSAFERPSRNIIVDDDLLDSWLIRQGEKIENKNQSNISSIPNKPDKNEMFIMADRDGARHVYDMNDPTTRAKIRARQKLINQRGNIDEQCMPDSQREMKQQLTNMQRQHVKSINRR